MIVMKNSILCVVLHCVCCVDVDVVTSGHQVTTTIHHASLFYLDEKALSNKFFEWNFLSICIMIFVRTQTIYGHKLRDLTNVIIRNIDRIYTYNI